MSHITAIIPAAGKPTNKILTHTNLPDTMLPINGKPVIGYILDDLLARHINTAIVILNTNDTQTETYIKKKYSAKLNLTTVYNTTPERGVGHSIHCALPHIHETSGILIYLGDTIYKGDLSFKTDFLTTTSDYESSDKWCFIERTESGDRFVHRPKDYAGTGLVLSGLYYFSNADVFLSTMTKLEQLHERFEISHILDSYPESFTLVPADNYYDCGNIENYYRAKIDFLKTRSFNTVIYNDLYGSITKTGEKKQKLEDEINWYKNIPQELQVFTPRLLDYSITDDRVEYSLEYYGYQSLADYFVFNHFDEKVWRLVIERLFDILELHKKYTTKIPFAFFDDMYRVKTLDRIDILKKDNFWQTLFETETVTINGSEYQGWPHFENKLSQIIESLHQESDMTFLHGDLCLSNILFDPNSRIFKFIDPRGSFGTVSVYGDIKYDLAKLRHSFSGRYDFIVSDLFMVEETLNDFSFDTFHDLEHTHIATYFDDTLTKHGYNLNSIRAIEALLFISMIPLHSDAPLRQRAMFLTGVQLLNQLEL